MLPGVELPEPAVDHVLATWPVACLATTDGESPHAVPIVFAWVRGYLWSPIDGKPKNDGELVRLRNVRSNERVSVLLDHYDDAWSRLWWLRVDGLAQIVAPPDPERDPDVAPVVAALREKYPQYQTTPLLADPPRLLAVCPTRIRTWCASAEAVPDLGRER
jgi:PPOX class probable F420-dependent enzyme